MEHLGRLVITAYHDHQRQMADADGEDDARERSSISYRAIPTCFQRVPQKYLASYLNIKPETFSRFKHLLRIACPRKQIQRGQRQRCPTTPERFTTSTGIFSSCRTVLIVSTVDKVLDPGGHADYQHIRPPFFTRRTISLARPPKSHQRRASIPVLSIGRCKKRSLSWSFSVSRSSLSLS